MDQKMTREKREKNNTKREIQTIVQKSQKT